VPAPRTVDVAPQRLSRWIAGFAERHGEIRVSPAGETLVLSAADGATAVLDPPFASAAAERGQQPTLEQLVARSLEPRTVALLLVRLGGYAAGVFEGEHLVASKVGSRPVHGRSAAGGWSQHRFARRREGQAKLALAAAAEAAVAIILPALPKLDAVVTGGDRQALRAVLGDVRLARLTPLVSHRVLDVPDPKARILRDSIQLATAVRVTITDPEV
jgi:hypothetical protein